MAKAAQAAVQKAANKAANHSKHGPRLDRAHRRGRAGGRRNEGLGMPTQKVQTAPAAVGVNYGASTITRRAGKVVAHADFGPEEGSERVSFCDIFSTAVQAGSATTTDGFGGTSTYSANLSPTGISPRLQQLEELYQFYAFRKLKIEYLPVCGSTTAVGVNLGIDQNADNVNNVAPPTVQQLMEYRPSMGGQAWQVMEMTYLHTGSKLWATTSSGSGDASEYAQGLLQCILDGTPVASTKYGKLRISGICDFYRDVPPNATNPALVMRRHLSAHTGEDLAKHVAMCKAYLELINDENVKFEDVTVAKDGIYHKGIRTFPDIKEYDLNNHDPRSLEKQVAQLTKIVGKLMVDTSDEKQIEMISTNWVEETPKVDSLSNPVKVGTLEEKKSGVNSTPKGRWF